MNSALKFKADWKHWAGAWQGLGGQDYLQHPTREGVQQGPWWGAGVAATPLRHPRNCGKNPGALRSGRAPNSKKHRKLKWPKSDSKVTPRVRPHPSDSKVAQK